MKLISIHRIPFAYVLRYFGKTKSLFRIYQNTLLSQVGPSFTGSVIELGGERKYNHAQYFTRASEFKVTNIGREYDLFLDATKMDLKDASVDNFIMISALQHVPNFLEAVDEIKRKLKPTGMVLIVNAFCHPYCDEKDYYRFGKDAYEHFFRDDFEILELYHLGGKFSGMANALQRPVGKLRGKYLIYKVIGFMLACIGCIIERPDSFPLGVGVLAKKK